MQIRVQYELPSTATHGHYYGGRLEGSLCTAIHAKAPFQDQMELKVIGNKGAYMRTRRYDLEYTGGFTKNHGILKI